MIAPVKDAKQARNARYSEYVTTLGQKMRGEIPAGYGLPWKSVEQRLGTLVPGRVIVIGARPGMGKTTTVMQMLDYVSLQSPALFLSLEMSFDEVVGKLVQANTGIERDRLDTGAISPSALSQVYTRVESLYDRPLFIVDDAMTLGKITREIRKYARTEGVKTVFIDYLQLISDPSRKMQNENVEVGYISQSLKRIAKQEKICIVLLSQLSRAVETRGGAKRPILSDLRSSGSIEQDADAIAFLYRPSYYGINEDEEGESNIGVTEVIIAKNRHNSKGVGVVKLYHDPVHDILSEAKPGEELIYDQPTPAYNPIIPAMSGPDDDTIPF